jgi:hypothetical protein
MNDSFQVPELHRRFALYDLRPGAGCARSFQPSACRELSELGIAGPGPLRTLTFRGSLYVGGRRRFGGKDVLRYWVLT